MVNLTKEWLQTTIAEYELRLRELPPYLDTNSRIELEAFKLALSALEAAPTGCQQVPKENTVDTRLVWTVVIGDKTGGEEPHFDYSVALQALILEAQRYQQEMQKNPQLEPRPIGLFCERVSAAEIPDI